MTTPQRIATSLLVVEQFRDSSGTTWMPGDRAQLALRAVRQAALARPELFMVEYSTEPVDREWLAEIDQRYTRQYDEIAESRRQAKAQEEKALRKEFEDQGKPPSRSQRELERRFKKQEAERERQKQEAAEAHERAVIENELAFRAGYHHQR